MCPNLFHMGQTHFPERKNSVFSGMFLKGLLKLIPALAFLFICNGISAQNNVTYRIIKGDNYSVSQLESALGMCQLDPYRQLDKETKMRFDDGAIVVLFSANTMKRNGFEINMNSINRNGIQLLNYFSIHPNGYVVEKVERLEKMEQYERQQEFSK